MADLHNGFVRHQGTPMTRESKHKPAMTASADRGAANRAKRAVEG